MLSADLIVNLQDRETRAGHQAGAEAPEPEPQPGSDWLQAVSRQHCANFELWHIADDATDYFFIPIHITGGTGPNQGRFGTLGRNTFRGPAFYNFDFALIKDTPFGRRKSGAELMSLQFRSEFFNLFNIVTLGLPNNILTGSGFGEISKTAGNSRQIQFSLKLIY